MSGRACGKRQLRENGAPPGKVAALPASIYLTPELQNRLIPLFHYALSDGGFLFLGTAENVTRHSRLFTTMDKAHRIFQRRLQLERRLPEFPLTAPESGRLRPDAMARAAVEHEPLQTLAERQLLDRYAPAYVVINADGELLYGSSVEELENASLRQLEMKLRTTRERLQTTTEELESSNEELQSANEELETSKEGLQSINEELQTVNAELSARVEELSRANSRHRQSPGKHADRHRVPRPQPRGQELHARSQGCAPPGRKRHRPANHPRAPALPFRYPAGGCRAGDAHALDHRAAGREQPQRGALRNAHDALPHGCATASRAWRPCSISCRLAS